MQVRSQQVKAQIQSPSLSSLDLLLALPQGPQPACP